MPPPLGRLVLALALGLVAGGCASQPSPFSSMRRSSLPANRPSGSSGALSDLTSGWKSPAAAKPDPVLPPASQGDKIQGPLALARLSERRGQPAQAEQLYRVVMERDPQNPTPYQRLGVMRAKEGRFKEADAFFAEALRRAPSDTNVLCDVGYSYYLQHRLEESEQVLRRALEIKPQDERVCNNLAVVVGDQGRDGEALVLFQRVGSEARAYANLAFIYTQRGEMDKAKGAYSRALALEPNLRPAAEAMVQLSQTERSPAPARAPAPAERSPADVQVSEATPRAPGRAEPRLAEVSRRETTAQAPAPAERFPADVQVSEATPRAPGRAEPRLAEVSRRETTALQPMATRVSIPAPSGEAAEPVRTATRQAVFEPRLAAGSVDLAGFAAADDRPSRPLVASRPRPEGSSAQTWPTIKVPSPPPIAEGVSTLGQRSSVPTLGVSAPGFPPPQPFPAVQSENLNPFVRW